MEREGACEVKVPQSIKHSLDQVRVHGCFYDDLCDDLVEPGLASGQVRVWQVTMRRAFRGLPRQALQASSGPRAEPT
jgi:hypothetical protein